REGAGAISLACGVRPLLEVLASVQPAGRTRGDFDNGACSVDGARARSRVPDSQRVHGADGRRSARGALVTPAERKAKKAPAAAEKRVELLFEIGVEEIPAGMLPKAEEELRLGLEKQLTAEGLAEGVVVESYAAPRRLVAHATGLLAKQKDVVSE